MKKFTNPIFLVIVLISFFAGCNENKKSYKTELTRKEETVKIVIDDEVLFYIPDNEKIIYKMEDRIKNSSNKEIISVNFNAFDYEQLKNFESESYSRELMKIFYNKALGKYDQIIDYLKTADFEKPELIMFPPRQAYKAYIKESHNKIIYNDRIIGEQVFYIRNASTPCTVEYRLLFVTGNKLISGEIETKITEEDAAFIKDLMEQKEDGYYWKSPKAEGDFYTLLESENYQNLTEKLKLLRETKDKFYETLVIKG